MLATCDCSSLLSRDAHGAQIAPSRSRAASGARWSVSCLRAGRVRRTIDTLGRRSSQPSASLQVVSPNRGFGRLSRQQARLARRPRRTLRGCFLQQNLSSAVISRRDYRPVREPVESSAPCCASRQSASSRWLQPAPSQANPLHGGLTTPPGPSGSRHFPVDISARDIGFEEPNTAEFSSQVAAFEHEAGEQGACMSSIVTCVFLSPTERPLWTDRYGG